MSMSGWFTTQFWVRSVFVLLESMWLWQCVRASLSLIAVSYSVNAFPVRECVSVVWL